jgi:multimeric flavodoxin WrbA
MEKIVILTGSPHNPGTSKTLADAFEKGARAAGNDIFRYDAGLQGKAAPHYLLFDARKNCWHGGGHSG